METCSICGKEITREDAPVLTISGYGHPRYLCDECAGEMDVAISSHDPEEIETSIKTLGEKMNNCNDGYATGAMYEFISVAGERLVKIKEGTYDFAVANNVCKVRKIYLATQRGRLNIFLIFSGRLFVIRSGE